MSVILDLDDHCFVLAGDYLTDLCRQVEKEAGRKPSIEELCELLTWGLRSCSLDILADVNPCNVLALKPKLLRKGKITVKPGDLVAIPARGGGYYFTVFITQEWADGPAFGIIKGKYTLKPPSEDWQPDTLQPPVYSDNRLIASGRWRVIGNYPHLLKLFPEHPEIYYPHKAAALVCSTGKGAIIRPGEVGPYGSAVTPGGRGVRHVSKEEAEALGLLSGEYHQGLLAEEFEEFLERRLGASSAKKKRRGKR